MRIAILGFGCRLPGGVVDGHSYWRLLQEGRDAVREVPPERWSIDAFYSETPKTPGKSASRWGGFLDEIDGFEPQCFGISPREAHYIDPQQRLLLETTWEALERAGLATDRLAGSRTGVFIGVSTSDYGQLQRGPRSARGLSAFTAQGNSLGIAANRISYCLDLRGPSFIVDTACSSSLVAMDRAVKSLQSRESDMALVGGVNCLLGPDTFISFSQAQMLSPDGRCKAFDASANGFVRAEGGGTLVLKRLEDALRDGDPIEAVILGSGVNQDGRTGGMALPSLDAQEALLREVYTQIGIAPHEVAYVEAHGTGTAIGDPTEAEALGRVFGQDRSPSAPLIMGSVKSNLGHLEAASGIASIIKSILVLQHREIPKNLHFETPNPRIAFDKHKLRVPVQHEAWPQDRPGILGINSFGFGGTNAHVVLGSFESVSASHSKPTPSKNGSTNGSANGSTNGFTNGASHHSVADQLCGDAAGREQPIVISARSETALRGACATWAEYLAAPANDGQSLSDVAYSAAVRRTSYFHRLSLVAANVDEARLQLKAYAAGESRPGMFAAEALRETPRVAFIFCGQGPQRARMGWELYRREPVFRHAIEEIDALLKPIVGWSLIEELSHDEEHSRIQLTSVAQPAIFAIQVALARLWESWGVMPDGVLGHSVGEIAAAHVAGIVSLESAVRVIGHRGMCLGEFALPGRMIAAALGETDALEVLREFMPQVCLGAINSPNMVTVSGEQQAVARLCERLTQQDIWWKQLQVEHAFHSHLVEPAQQPFTDRVGEIPSNSVRCEMIRAVDATPVNGSGLDADYWWDNIRRPVRFAAGVEALRERGFETFVEIGPHPVLGASIKQCRKAGAKAAVVFPSMIRDEDERRTMLSSLGGLHTHGVAVNWKALWPKGGKCLELPAHGWTHESFWHESEETRRMIGQPDFHPLLGYGDPGSQRTWRTTLDLHEMPWLVDHRAGGKVIFPAAGFVEMAAAAVARTLGTEQFTIDDFDIMRALFLPSGATPMLEVVVDPTQFSVTISSRRGDEDESWVKHCQATYRAAATSVDRTPLDVESWRDGSAFDVAMDACYEELRCLGLDYGPAFRGLREVWRREKHVLGRAELPAEAMSGSAQFRLHPALLDACFQLLFETIPLEMRSTERMFLPVRMGRIRILGPISQNAWCEVRLRSMSDTLVVGDYRIYNESGELAVEIGGMQGRGVASPKELGSEGIGECFFRTEWHSQPLPEVPLHASALQLSGSLAELVEGAEQAAQLVWNDMPPLSAEQGFSARDPLARNYFLAALRDLGQELTAGAVIDVEALVSDGRISDRHRPLVECCLNQMVAAGDAEFAAGRWTLAHDLQIADSEAMWRDILETFPEMYPDLRLLEICGTNLAGVLSGAVDPLGLLFSPEATELLEQVYQDQPWTRYGNTFIQQLIVEMSRRLPADRPLRVLEIGAGTGGTTSNLLPAMPRGRGEYWYTDVSPFFLTRASERFRQYEGVRYQRFDLERGLAEQEIPAHSFDLVIAADVLHATADVRQSLRRCAEALTDGGVLALRELCVSTWTFDLVFGLMEGWWKFRQDPARPAGPLLKRDEWKALLAEEGFAGAAAPPTCDGLTRMAVLVAQNAPATQPPAPGIESSTPADSAEPKPDPVPAESQWIVFGGASADALAARLRSHGRRCVIVGAGDSYEQLDGDQFRINPTSIEDLRRLRTDCQIDFQQSYSIVQAFATDVAGGMDAATDEIDAAEDLLCIGTMHLIQAFGGEVEPAPQRIFLVTVGANELGLSGQEMRPLHATLIGVGRVAATELRGGRMRMIDLDPREPLAASIAALWSEMVTSDAQEEVSWRRSQRFVPRLAPSGESRATEWRGTPTPVTAVATRSGDLGSIELQEISVPEPGVGEVQIEVRYVALNFRDILRGLGRLPVEDRTQLQMGDECSGIVLAVGPGITRLKAGDRVAACSAGCFRSVLNVPIDRVTRLPDYLTLAAAVSMPVAYITADYSLRDIGRLRPGQSVLIHSAAGGLGMAAMHVARRLGAEIYATAGADAKRVLLLKYGAKRVLNSRTLDFADEILDETNGRGIDVILNSLAGQAMARSLACVAPYGRFLELGKRDFYENTKVGLWPFRRNVSYHAVDLAAVLDAAKHEQNLLESLLNGEGADRLPPLPMRVLPVGRLSDALRHMARGAHIGKIVLDMSQTWGRIRRTPTRQAIRSDATYLLTGAFGGVGLAVARWLVDQGAKHLALVSRSGPQSAAALAAVEELRQAGVEVAIFACDVANSEQIEHAIEEVQQTMPPLVGVIHLAMVLDDGMLVNLDRERFQRVTRPKVQGAWNLHRLTRDLPLEMFVLFGSSTARFGNFGQANYGAANSALEALAHARRAAGMPATTIAWGMLAEVGFVAERPELADSLLKTGLLPIDVKDIRAALDLAVADDDPAPMVMRADWSKLFPKFQLAQRVAGLFSKLSSGEEIGATGEAGEGLREAIAAAAPGDRLAMVQDFLRSRVGDVLGMSPAKLELDRPLPEMGLDSLMAVELATAIESSLTVTLSMNALARDATIDSLSQGLLKALFGDSGGAPQSHSEQQTPKSSGHLVPLRRGGSELPLFCIHPAGGDVTIYDGLVEALGDDVPVYGVQSRLNAGFDSEYATLEEMVAAYVQEIRQIQPAGPYRLFGFSMGGFLAGLMAEQLEAQGHEVQLVSVAEWEMNRGGSQEERGAALTSLFAATFGHFQRLSSILKPISDADLREQLTPLVAQIIDPASSGDSSDAIMAWVDANRMLTTSEPTVRARARQYFGQLQQHCILIADGLREPQFRGRLAVWRATDGFGTTSHTWGRSNGDAHDFELPGDHFSIFSSPAVERLAEQLKSQLAATHNGSVHGGADHVADAALAPGA